MSFELSRKPPAYVAIAERLRSRIENEEVKAGDRLPTERDLVEEFGVARMTIRHALDLLQLEGLIDRKRGRTGGTFIRAVPPVMEMTRIEGFLPQLRERDLEVASTVLAADLRKAPNNAAIALDIDAGAPVFHVLRLRSVEGTPLLIEASYFPAELVPGLLEHDLAGSIYELLAAEWGLAPVRKWETVEPSVASGWEQEKLSVGRNLQLLRITRTAQAANGRIVEYSQEVLRTDVATIQVVTEV